LGYEAIQIFLRYYTGCITSVESMRMCTLKWSLHKRYHCGHHLCTTENEDQFLALQRQRADATCSNFSGKRASTNYNAMICENRAYSFDSRWCFTAGAAKVDLSFQQYMSSDRGVPTVVNSSALKLYVPLTTALPLLRKPTFNFKPERPLAQSAPNFFRTGYIHDSKFTVRFKNWWRV